jgi:transcriptional regulator with XRE-family HTH domain
MSTLGETIRWYRFERRLFQRELGDRVGCARSYISEIELGQRRPPLRTVALLAEALDTQLGPLWRSRHADDTEETG